MSIMRVLKGGDTMTEFITNLLDGEEEKDEDDDTEDEDE